MSFLYQVSGDDGKFSPYIISIWSGYHAASLAVAAFAFLEQAMDAPIERFASIIFASTVGIMLGRLPRRVLSRPLLMKHLAPFLALAVLLSGAPALYADVLLRSPLISAWNDSAAALTLACALLTPPMLLLSAFPAYASATRNRRSGGSSSNDSTVFICTTLGCCAGAPVTACYLERGLDPSLALELLFCGLLVVSVVIFTRHPILKPRTR